MFITKIMQPPSGITTINIVNGQNHQGLPEPWPEEAARGNRGRVLHLIDSLINTIIISPFAATTTTTASAALAGTR